MPFAFSQQNSPPLSEDELRIVLEQLRTYEVEHKELQSCTDRLEKEQAMDATEDARAKELLELEQQRTAIAKKEADLERQRADLAQEKADFYENAYKALTKKPGIFCRIARTATLGIFYCR
jgi:hypothetical protein